MYRLEIPSSGENLSIVLNAGETLFVLGANGVGKSSLIQRLTTNFSESSIRIVAHRQSWFNTGIVDVSPSQKKSYDDQIKLNNLNSMSRYNDFNGHQRPVVSIYNLLNSENIRARKLASAFDANQMDEAKTFSEILSPLGVLNELLSLANINIKISTNDNDEFIATRSNGASYSINELSDGERNAFLICSDVLTAPSGFLIFLDEPERHLHRSVIAPLLSALVRRRDDCMFVISTHDIDLPINDDKSSILLVRGCSWLDKYVYEWDVDYLDKSEDIPDDIKSDVLGAKRNILFVEGKDVDSLDRGLYQIIFPKFSVIAQETCVEVERSLKGVRSTESLHWLNAFGLIDADDRTSEEIQKLYSQNVATVKCHSVEALYYNLDIVKLIAKRISNVVGRTEGELYDDATRDLMKNFKEKREHFCARICERKARQSVMSRLPTHKNVQENDEHLISIDLKVIRDKEYEIFDRFVNEGNLNELINRYPIRESQVCTTIEKGFSLTKKSYAGAVRKLIAEEQDAKNVLMGVLSNLNNLINEL